MHIPIGARDCQDFLDQCSIVGKPNTKRITGFISQPAAFERDLNMADILFGSAARDLLIDQKLGDKWVFLCPSCG